MKKKILGVRLLLVGTLVMLLSSCLGDGENTQSSSGEFMYITDVNGRRYATFSTGYLIHEKFSEYEDGTCVIASYKVSLESSNISSLGYKADYVIIDPANVYPKANQFKGEENGDYFASVEGATKDEAFNSFYIRFSSYNQHWGDRWLLEYSCDMTEEEKEQETTSIMVYYNPDNQVDAFGLEVEQGTCILDVVLQRNGGGSGGETNTTTAWKIIDFTDLRKNLKSQAVEESSGISTLNFKFRYLTIDKTSDEVKLHTQVTSNYGLAWAAESDQ